MEESGQKGIKRKRKMGETNEKGENRKGQRKKIRRRGIKRRNH